MRIEPMIPPDTLALDKQIAEKIFGMVPCNSQAHKDGAAELPCYADPKTPGNGSPLKNYSGNHDFAWEAAEKVGLFSHDTMSLIKNSAGYWEIRDIDYQAGDWKTLAEGPTPAVALCLATLRKAEHLSAQASPRQISGPHLIKPIATEAFKGKSFIETLVDGVRDAKKKAKKIMRAPAAPRHISKTGKKQAKKKHK